MTASLYNRLVDEQGAQAREVELLIKQGCSLCGQVRAALDSLAPELGFQVSDLDIGAEPELAGRYGSVVPVVRVAGMPLLSGRMGSEEFRRELKRAFGPNPRAGIPPEEEQFLPVLHCPVCEGPLESRPRAVACLSCGKEYERRNGVLHLMAEPEEPGRPGILDWVLKIISFKLEDRGRS